MGVDAGFDMVPQLSNGAVDKQNWDNFIRLVKQRYEKDPQVEVKSNYMVFKVGECPRLPFEGHKFLRFSSEISGSNAASVRVEEYINTVTRLAELTFGSRVRYWERAIDEIGHYSWREVHESVQSYEQPDEPGSPVSTYDLAHHRDSVVQSGSPLFEVRAIPGKGLGLVARISIPKGCRILVEAPLLIAQDMPQQSLEPLLGASLQSKSKDQQRQFLSLGNNFPDMYPLSGIFRTNVFSCAPGSGMGAVYPSISLINHSCLPNAYNNWNEESACGTVHAVRSINSGEEITICYMREGPSHIRRAQLKDSYGFDCHCMACSLPPEALRSSDTRQLRIHQLDAAIGDPRRVMLDPDGGIADCRALLQVLKEEYGESASALTARLYYDAFQICIAHGDQSRAAAFAERAWNARVICEGVDSSEAKFMQRLMEEPATHPSFAGYSVRWQSRKEDNEQRLDKAEFERWLWKQ